MSHNISVDDLDAWNAYTNGISRISSSKSITPITKSVFVKYSNECFQTFFDCHGLTINEAYLRTHALVQSSPLKFITIITGNSGLIKQEFPHWFQHHPRVKRIEQINGGGAFRIFLRKITP